MERLFYSREVCSPQDVCIPQYPEGFESISPGNQAKDPSNLKRLNQSSANFDATIKRHRRKIIR
jgi:hypothetical protein